MRWWLVCTCVVACTPQPTAEYPGPTYAPPSMAPAMYSATEAGTVVDRKTDFAFDGGRIEIEMRLDGNRVVEVARSRYAVPIVMQWSVGELVNLEPIGPVSGAIYLPAADKPNGVGGAVVLTSYALRIPDAAFNRKLRTHARFGDPQARPEPYPYRLPYQAGKTFTVLQGFHGQFSHRGSNEYAVDFDCPVATSVLAARPGVVVAANAAAQGSGTTSEFLDYARTNFVLILHDDGTLGEYMHLAPSGVRVSIGQRVERGDELALSGNTGYSSTPHLHFQVMTAGSDGLSALSFPFELAVAPNQVEAPVQGRAYPSWE
ncbi:MAG: M23 family metallopeptidase [Kofleriaceae bacterium]|nr:M23 family metallopeptidase [Kofleriaceae bacterium]